MTKYGFVLKSLDDHSIAEALRIVERFAPHVHRGFYLYLSKPATVRRLLKPLAIKSLCWYNDNDFLYWGHANFKSLTDFQLFLGEL